MILIVKPAARSDILRQVSYYSDLERPDVALRFVGAIELSFEVLSKTPFAGSPRYFDDVRLQGLRTWPVQGFDHFRIYYLIQDDRLTVVRILHGRRDVERIITDFDDFDH